MDDVLTIIRREMNWLLPQPLEMSGGEYFSGESREGEIGIRYSVSSVPPETFPQEDADPEEVAVVTIWTNCTGVPHLYKDSITIEPTKSKGSQVRVIPFMDRSRHMLEWKSTFGSAIRECARSHF